MGAGKRLALPLAVAFFFIIAYTIRYSSDSYSTGTVKDTTVGNVTKLYRDQKSVKDIPFGLPISVFTWIRSCRNLSRLVLLEPDSIRCLINASYRCNRVILPFYRFGLVEANRAKALAVLSKLVSRSTKQGWWEAGHNDSALSIALSNGETIVIVSVVEIRFDYVYVYGTTTDMLVQQSPRAFIGINFTTAEFRLHRLIDLLTIPSPVDYYLWQWPRSSFVECNRTSAAYLRKKYPSIYSSPPTIRDEYIDELAHVRDIMLNRRITTLLAGGTALGWYRECGIIPDTTDLDFMFPISEWKPELENDLKTSRNLSLYWILGKVQDSLELSVHVRGVKIDLFALYTEDKRSWVGGMIVPEKLKLRWWYPRYQRACSMDLKGRMFYVPCNVRQFLIADYGPQWYEPHREANFVWHSSHHNVERVSKWSDAEWKSVYRTFNVG